MRATGAKFEQSEQNYATPSPENSMSIFKQFASLVVVGVISAASAQAEPIAQITGAAQKASASQQEFWTSDGRCESAKSEKQIEAVLRDRELALQRGARTDDLEYSQCLRSLKRLQR